MNGLLIATAFYAAFASAAPQQASPCLHGRDEAPAQQARREKALRLARAINAAEVIGVGPQKGSFRPLNELSNVPPTPSGFALQFNTDGATYSFSLKDTLDACHYAIFSDQDKLVYDGTALTDAFIMPVSSRE